MKSMCGLHLSPATNLPFPTLPPALHGSRTYAAARAAGVSIGVMESALVRVVFVVQALLLLLLLRIFVIVIIIWAFMQLAYRCRKKQSIIAVRRAEEGEGGREGRHRCHPAMEHLADSPPMSVCGSGPSRACIL